MAGWRRAARPGRLLRSADGAAAGVFRGRRNAVRDRPLRATLALPRRALRSRQVGQPHTSVYGSWSILTRISVADADTSWPLPLSKREENRGAPAEAAAPGGALAEASGSGDEGDHGCDARVSMAHDLDPHSAHARWQRGLRSRVGGQDVDSLAAPRHLVLRKIRQKGEFAVNGGLDLGNVGDAA